METGHTAPPDDLLDDADPQRRRALTQAGRKLVPQLWGLIRTLGMYDPDNETPHRAAAALCETLVEIQSMEEAAALIVFGDSAFLNGCRLRLDHATYRLVRKLATFLSDRNLGGICFHRGHRTDKLMQFLLELRDANRHEDSKAYMEEYLLGQEIPDFTLINPHRHRTEGPGEDEEGKKTKRAALEVYARAMYALSERAGTFEGAMGRSRRQTVAVRRLVVLSEGDQETFLQLSAVRGLGSPVLNHSLNTTILSLTLGRNAGLSRQHLVRLGIAAMNHNVGEMVPREWDWEVAQAGGPGPRSDEAIAHTLKGMYLILTQHGISQRSLQRAIVAAEHHRHYDGIGGFPELPPAKPHLFSRIVAVCDAYDTLVWSPVEDTRLPPDQALRRITRGSGEIYDPLLVRLFAAMVGRYPPGSLVELDTGDLAIVLARGRQLEGQARPRVLRIRDDMGQPVLPQQLDLSEKVPGKRRFVYTIVRTRDPVRLHINVANYLFTADDIKSAKQAADGDADEPSLNSPQG